MYMTAFLPYLINWLQEYGYVALWFTIFVAAAGVPLPIGLVLLAAGAFASFGDFNIVWLTVIAISALVCGDNLGYLIGRLWGSRLLNWLECSRRLPFLSPGVVVRSRVYFRLRGGWAVFLSRFLFSALGGITNLLAGADPYPYPRFLLYDASGELLGAVIPLGLGFIFGASWEALGDLMGAISVSAFALLVAIWLIVHMVKIAQRTKMEVGNIRIQARMEGGANTHTGDRSSFEQALVADNAENLLP
jgi:membrane-associated protein